MEDQNASGTGALASVPSSDLLAELREILAEYADEENWHESTAPVQGMYISNGHTEDHYTECFVDGMHNPARRGLEILDQLSANRPVLTPEERGS